MYVRVWDGTGKSLGTTTIALELYTTKYIDSLSTLERMF
jgi:hypothetical protein